MVNIDEAVTAKITKQGIKFEILVDCDKAMQFREGKLKDINEALATNEIFKDVKKGLLASEHELQNIFKTTNPEDISKEIIKHGEIQVTAEYKNKEHEQKKKKIIEIIRTNAINPQTGLPHPAERIKNAIEQAKVHIDEHRKAEEQIQDVLKKINSILPIKFEVRQIETRVPAHYASHAYSFLKQFSKLSREEWLGDGSLLAVLEIPAGLQEEFENSINSLTHGEAEIKVINLK
jgi:ribosome maturation protein SDO1